MGLPRHRKVYPGLGRQHGCGLLGIGSLFRGLRPQQRESRRTIRSRKCTPRSSVCIDEAIEEMQRPGGDVPGVGDVVFGGDMAAWVKLAEYA